MRGIIASLILLLALFHSECRSRFWVLPIVGMALLSNCDSTALLMDCDGQNLLTDCDGQEFYPCGCCYTNYSTIILRYTRTFDDPSETPCSGASGGLSGEIELPFFEDSPTVISWRLYHNESDYSEVAIAKDLYSNPCTWTIYINLPALHDIDPSCCILGTTLSDIAFIDCDGVPETTVSKSDPNCPEGTLTYEIVVANNNCNPAP